LALGGALVPLKHGEGENSKTGDQPALWKRTFAFWLLWNWFKDSLRAYVHHFARQWLTLSWLSRDTKKKQINLRELLQANR
jgi:hypothetical protein